MAARWLRLHDGKTWNAELRAAMAGRSGVYVVRVRSTKRALYVGESHTGRAWKTLLRHFQGLDSGLFEARSEWVCKHCDGRKLDVKFYPTRADAALSLEAKKIALFRPTYGNRTPGAENWVPF